MASKKTSARRTTPGAWFDSFPKINPPGWDDKDGWCTRHWAPLAAIGDPAQRACAQRLATLELMVLFASALRRRVHPLPVPAHKLTALTRELAPACCWLGDGNTRAVVLTAIETASRTP